MRANQYVIVIGAQYLRITAATPADALATVEAFIAAGGILRRGEPQTYATGTVVGGGPVEHLADLPMSALRAPEPQCNVADPGGAQ